ncbi:MAG TPA: leucine-rich repeat domain-containing protein [Candidatus Intestinimonas stercorigallinarum]|nr:leucine-rich repeat domain-containing protein [Candidatus Intestinimonas stercorigallinarum]
MPDRDPPRNQVPLYIQQSVANGVTIDWGDGSDPETLPGTRNVNTTHTYQTAGDFVITLDPAEGCTLGLGAGNSVNCVLGPTKNNGRVYCGMLQRAVIGSRGIRSIGICAFQYCSSLASVTIPDGVTSIGSYAFQYCFSLASVTIPDGVTSIGTYAFHNCYGVKEYHLLPTTPPSLSNANAFNSIPSDCIIYVPVGSLEAYQTATNWSTYADQMREEGT